jgi:lysophospholipase L1-like esterase
LSVFNGLEYIASYRDLMLAFGADKAAGELHYNNIGRAEGRFVSFDGLEYIASYADLSNAFGLNRDAGAAHFIQSGQREGRTVTFDGLEYIASYADLRGAFGANGDAGSAHFITSGRFEGRVSTFDGLEYIASYADLANAFGANSDAGAAHFISRGANEGRDPDSFSAYHYLNNYTDLKAAFGNNIEAATAHYITRGRFEGRTDAAIEDWAGGLRIMPLGDSITRGMSGDPAREGYRGPLFDLFGAADQSVNFVGDFQTGTFGDPEHQGVSGLTASELLAGQTATGQNVSVAGALQRHAPETVLLMIGTNDVLREANAAATVPNEIVGIINQIHAVDPGIHVLVAKLPVLSASTGADVPARLAATNAGITSVVNQLENAGRAVSLVDTGSLSLGDLADGIHPNPTGYAKLASAWFDAIQDEVPHPSGDFIV